MKRLNRIVNDLICDYLPVTMNIVVRFVIAFKYSEERIKKI